MFALLQKTYDTLSVRPKHPSRKKKRSATGTIRTQLAFKFGAPTA
jgi:hypothetical protein